MNPYRWLAVARRSALALGLGAFSASAAATTIDFDDIANANGSPIVAGYSQLAWSNFDVLDTVAFENANGPSGYSNGAVSPPNVALNGHGQPAYFGSGSAFTLNDLFLTSAWMDGMDVQIRGLRHAGVVYETTQRIDTTAPTHVVLDWVGIDKVEFAAAGGALHGYVDKDGVPGEQFALDKVTLNGPVTTATVPEPATWAMLTLGLGLGGAALRRRRAVTLTKAVSAAAPFARVSSVPTTLAVAVFRAKSTASAPSGVRRKQTDQRDRIESARHPS